MIRLEAALGCLATACVLIETPPEPAPTSGATSVMDSGATTDGAGCGDLPGQDDDVEAQAGIWTSGLVDQTVCARDPDWWLVAVPPNALYRARVLSEEEVVVMIRDPRSEERTTTSLTAITGPGAAFLALRVEVGTGQADYVIELDARDCAAEEAEEPNDTRWTAAAISWGVPAAGTIQGYGDDWWYLGTVAVGNRVDVDFDPGWELPAIGTDRPDLSLLDSAGLVLAEDSALSQTTLDWTNDTGQAHDVWLHVALLQDFRLCGVSYQITAEVMP